MSRLRARVARLVARQSGRVSPEECDGTGNTHLVSEADGFDPPHVTPCRTCGGRHAVVIREVIVERAAGGELVAIPTVLTTATTGPAG